MTIVAVFCPQVTFSLHTRTFSVFDSPQRVNTRALAFTRKQIYLRGGITSGVPYGDVVGPPLFEEERPSDGADGIFELSLRVPVKERRLAHVHVPQKHHFHVGLPHLRRLGHVVFAAASPRRSYATLRKIITTGDLTRRSQERRVNKRHF